MGMRLKPATCRSFSIRSGVPSRINLLLVNQKFQIYFKKSRNSLANFYFLLVDLVMHIFDYIKSEFETKLININALIIRDEFKVWIYKHYFIPSIRFLLSVHTISQTFYKHFITDITAIGCICSSF